MSTEVPGTADPIGDGDAAASRYLATQVQQARKNLQQTRIVGLLLLLLLGGELIYITAHFSSSLEPHAAAEIADGIVMQQINDRGPDLAVQLKEKIPEYIEQTPDYALKQMPLYRTQLEDRLETRLKEYCDKTSQQLDTQLDAFLTDHKDEIKGLIANGNDPAITKQVGIDLKKQFMDYIRTKSSGGESIQEQLDISLAALQASAKTMHHLAAAKGLTAQEKQTRHALAVLTSSIAVR